MHDPKLKETFDDGEGRFLSLARSGKLARTAKRAIERQRAAGLPVTFKKGDRIVRQHADGRVEVIGTVTPSSRRRPRIGAIVTP